MPNKPKLYFRNIDDELCRPLSSHLEIAKAEGLSEISLYETEKDYIDGLFWCGAVDSYGEDGDCGRKCIDYDPRNGKSGICKHKSKAFYEPAELVTFKIN
jgi:hypothetical protein